LVENNSEPRRNGKSDAAFRTISEVASDLGLPQHVLRFWETKFPQVRPMKRGGGRRYYRPDDVKLLRGIRDLLHKDGYTIKGVQKLLKESGAKELAAQVDARPAEVVPLPAPSPAVSAPAPVDLRKGELEGILTELVELSAILREARG
jgi:DNA-binding transcriptional MerR regulator